MTLLKQILTGSKYGGVLPIHTVNVGRPGEPSRLIIHRGRIFVYNSQGQSLVDGGYIAARAIAALSITASRLAVGAKKFTHNIVFTATDDDTASWTSGSITFADGSSRSINSGNTGNLAAKSYIYYNGSATLQKTTDYSSAIGGNNIPLAIIEPTSDVDGKCIITSFFTGDTTIDGDLITTGRIESADGKTYFDLNEDRLVVSDGIDVRVVIGKIDTDVYGIKVSLQGYDALTDTNIRHFALWALSTDTNDNVLIKEKTRGSSSVGNGWANRLQIAHGLSYVPFCLVFYEKTSGEYVKVFGSPYDPSSVGAYFTIDGTYLTMVNESGSTKTFKYYIFYDQMSS